MDKDTLRIGNVIYATSSKNPAQKTRAVIIDYKDLEFSYVGNNLGRDKVNIEPIEITDNLLLENNLIKNSNYPLRFYFPNCSATFFVNKDVEQNEYYIGMEESGKNRRVSISFKYVHELQNAIFFIRGIKLEFNKV